jgi:hypothetical protein
MRHSSPSRLLIATFVAVSMLGAGGCANTTAALPAGNADANVRTLMAQVKKTGKIDVSPASLDILAAGSGNALTAAVSSAGYTGIFTSSNTCKGVATIKPERAKGPKFTVTATGAKAGSCAVTFADADHQTATLKVDVTTTAVQLKAPVPSAADSVTIALKSVDGKPPAKTLAASVTRKLKDCTNGCTVEGPPSPPGKDVFSATIVNAKGGPLASEQTATVQIGAAKANAVPFTFVAFGSLTYACTTGCPSPAPSSPEIDLTSATKGSTGNAATFTVKQTGWSNPFTYTFAGVKGFPNNCPSGSAPSYAVTPASGAAGTSFTVTATSAATGGECLLTLTGGGGNSIDVLLTFTTSSIGVENKALPR